MLIHRAPPSGWLRPEQRGRAPHAGVRTAAAASLEGLRRTVMLEGLPETYDQGRVGSCTAQALAAVIEYLLVRAGYPAERPDRPALYARIRALIGTSGEDSGGILADGVLAVRRGWEAEFTEPPSVWGERWTRLAPLRANDAPRLINSEPLDFDVPTIATELDAGHPVVVGLSITEQWSRAWGQAVLPEPAGEVTGGHAVALVGYDLGARAWVVRNSWGVEWGIGGYALLPWRWVSLPWCGEAHVLRAVRRAEAPPRLHAPAAANDDGPSMGAQKTEALKHFLAPMGVRPDLAAVGIEHDYHFPSIKGSRR